MADQRIIINVDSKWLITHLSFEERQIFVFENTWKLRLLTIFDEVGMSQKVWESEVGPSVSAQGKYSWEKIVYLYHLMVQQNMVFVGKLVLLTSMEKPHGN